MEILTILKALSEKLQGTFYTKTNLFTLELPTNLIDGEKLNVVILQEKVSDIEDWWNTIYVGDYAFDINLWCDCDSDNPKLTIYPIINNEVDYTNYYRVNLTIK